MHIVQRLVRVGVRPLEKPSGCVACKGEEHEKVATRFLLLGAVLRSCESAGSFLSKEAYRAASLDLPADHIPLRFDIRTRPRSKYCAVPLHVLE